MHGCSMGSRSPGVCRSFVAFCNKLWKAVDCWILLRRTSLVCGLAPKLGALSRAAVRGLLGRHAEKVQFSIRLITTALFGTW